MVHRVARPRPHDRGGTLTPRTPRPAAAAYTAIGATLAASLTAQQRLTLCGIINRFASGGPFVEPHNLQFATHHAVRKAIKAARPLFNDEGNAMLDTILTSLGEPTA